jgi:hypothetical protein
MVLSESSQAVPVRPSGRSNRQRANGGRLDGIVRSRTQATEVVFFILTANGFVLGGSCTTIRQHITQVTQNNTRR